MGSLSCMVGYLLLALAFALLGIRSKKVVIIKNQQGKVEVEEELKSNQDFTSL